jgi:hypothetical protein
VSNFLNNTMRTNRISVVGGMVFKHLFTDTQPNATFIFNRGTTDLFVSRKFNVNSSNEYDIKIPPKTQISLVKVIGYKELYFYTDNDCVIDLESFEVSDLKPSDIPEAQSVVFINNQAITLGSIQAIINDVNTKIVASLPSGTNNIGDVDVLSLPALPPGTNNIGDVDIVSLPALPSGTNNIGKVDINVLPSLPVGTNNIGKVDINTLPINDFISVKITLTAGVDYTVKASSGYVGGIMTTLSDVLVKDNTTEIWKCVANNINFTTPIKISTSIQLNSATGGTVYIVYK